jgi:hypothetical protein
LELQEEGGFFSRLVRSFYDFPVYWSIARGSGWNAVGVVLLVVAVSAAVYTYQTSIFVQEIVTTVQNDIELRPIAIRDGRLEIPEPWPYIAYEQKDVLVAYDPEGVLEERLNEYNFAIYFQPTEYHIVSPNDRQSLKIPPVEENYEWDATQVSAFLDRLPALATKFLAAWLVFATLVTRLLGLVLVTMAGTGRTARLAVPLDFAETMKIGAFAMVLPSVLRLTVLPFLIFPSMLGFIIYMGWFLFILRKMEESVPMASAGGVGGGSDFESYKPYSPDDYRP